MKLAIQNITLLDQIGNLLSELDENLFNKKHHLIHQATVGQHIRHILEFYQCIISGQTKTQICYDGRKRDLKLETDLRFALKTIESMKEDLNLIDGDQAIAFCASYSMDENDQDLIQSSLGRELAYAMDHTIHHLAIVKIVLTFEGVEIASDLGVAPSTLRFRKQTVQLN